MVKLYAKDGVCVKLCVCLCEKDVCERECVIRLCVEDGVFNMV